MFYNSNINIKILLKENPGSPGTGYIVEMKLFSE